MGQFGEILVNLITPLLVALAISFVALGLGALLVRAFIPGRHPPLVESFALGILIISLLTLFWGLIGWLGPSARWSLQLLLILLGVLGWIQARPVSPLNPASFKNRTILVLSLLLAIGVLLRIVLSPLMPPMALDECRSHLPTVLAALEHGRVSFHPEISFNSYPQNAEMLYLWAVASSPVVSAHYINFIGFVFSLLALVRLGRAVYSVKTGWLAAVVMASMGALQALAGQASPDIWMLFFVLTAILVLTEGLKEGSVGKILLAGIFMGAAAGVGYTALPAILALVISLLTLGRSRKESNRIPPWVFLGAILLFILVALPWYVRNMFWFGNPVFPFYSSVFPPGDGIYGALGSECAVRVEWMFETVTTSYYLQHGGLWPIVLGMWSTWVAIPAGIWFWRSNPFARAAITWTILIWAFWMILGGGIMHFPYYIYLVPVNLLVLAHLLGILYSTPSGDRRGRFFRIVLWIFLIGWIGITGAATSQLIPPVTSHQQMRSLSHLHGSYDLMMAANQAIAEDRAAVGILCEDGRLYADFRLFGGGDVGWANHRVISDSCTSPEALAALLHDHYHVNYLIVQVERLREQDSPVFAPIKSLLRSTEFPEMFREVARVGQGVVYYVGNPE